jgi:hypothetical protein
MMDGILDIKLIPEWDTPSIHGTLKAALSRADLLQAGVAFWTVNDSKFGSCLPKALGHDSGFLCVDLHPPTDIDALASLVNKGAHVYWYCEEIPTSTAHGRKEPLCLMHTKMLLFWSKGGNAELWVGSHNWTNRAILGLNVESSLAIRLTDAASLFCDAATFLAKTRNISQEFDPSNVDFYKELQRSLSRRTTPVIELEGKNAGALGTQTIGLFGTDSDDLKDLGTVERDVYVSMFDADTGDEYLYPATILQSGLLSASHPSARGISFSPRRFAYRMGRRFPVLLPENEVGTDVLKSAQYFVTLALRNLDDSVVADYVPQRAATWDVANEQSSPLLRRMDPIARQELFGNRGARLRRPTRNDAQQTEALTLADRRNSIERSLVTRRILRPKG